VHVDIGTFLPKFFTEATSGKERNVSLFDLASGGNEDTQVSQTNITDAIVSGLSFSSDGGTVLTLIPHVFGIGSPDTNAGGKSFAVDLATGKQGTSATVAANTPTAGGSQDAGDGDYYLSLAGMDGGVRTASHKNTFVIDSFSFDVPRSVTTGIGSTWRKSSADCRHSPH
jgi:hypothetical protein